MNYDKGFVNTSHCLKKSDNCKNSSVVMLLDLKLWLLEPI